MAVPPPAKGPGGACRARMAGSGCTMFGWWRRYLEIIAGVSGFHRKDSCVLRGEALVVRSPRDGLVLLKSKEKGESGPAHRRRIMTRKAQASSRAPPPPPAAPATTRSFPAPRVLAGKGGGGGGGGYTKVMVGAVAVETPPTTPVTPCTARSTLKAAELGSAAKAALATETDAPGGSVAT